MFSHLKSLTLLVLALILLSACEGVRKQFGMGKSSPDEFRVVSRAPLTMPPIDPSSFPSLRSYCDASTSAGSSSSRSFW